MCWSKTTQINMSKSHITQSRGSSPDCHILFRHWVLLVVIGIMSYSLTGCLPDPQKQAQSPSSTLNNSLNSSVGNSAAKPTDQPTNRPDKITQAEPTASPTANPVRQDLAQFLPIGARFTVNNSTVKDTVIELEVAQTPAQQTKGLMYRPALAPNRGMLFAFPPGQVVAFWMKNVPVDLDMMFISGGKIVAISTAVPCVMEPCALYPSNQGIAVDQVIELRAGRARELGLTEGDSVMVELLNPPQ